MMKRIVSVLVCLICAVSVSDAAPRFAVNIVVSGMRQSDIRRYESNFCKGGFVRLKSEGIEFAECYADYVPTSSEAGLATLATGAHPSTHGIISKTTYDRIYNKEVKLFYNNNPELARTIGQDIERVRSVQSFMVPTLSETMTNDYPRNRVVTIAHNPVSAMILAGRKGECYWLNHLGRWVSADCYMKALPEWVRTYNGLGTHKAFATDSWCGRLPRDRYRNQHNKGVLFDNDDGFQSAQSTPDTSPEWAANMRLMPSGNIAMFEFAKSALVSMLPVQSNGGVKMLNLCFDVPRAIAEKYGSDSIEYEDMLYAFDASLASFLTFLYAQFPSHEDVVVTLTSDGGMSPSERLHSDDSRFNVRQFRILVNAFLSARFGQDSWVLGYSNGSLYLNHDVIYRHNKTIAEVQEECVAFVMKYRGVVAATTATALRSAQFSKGLLDLVQSGYSQRRSGDVLLVLDVERIEHDPKRVAMSGSPYGYDRHIPFIISGGGITPHRVSSRVTNDQIAPSLAVMLGVDKPQCSDAELLNF